MLCDYQSDADILSGRCCHARVKIDKWFPSCPSNDMSAQAITFVEQKPVYLKLSILNFLSLF